MYKLTGKPGAVQYGGMTERWRPIMLAVDDDPQVLRAIRRDLQRAYAERYRVVTAASGAEGLQVLDVARSRREELALLITDQRMPGMTGVELLAQGLSRFPSARRVLLTAFADTDAAIAAINEIHLDHYLVKPWDPPDERLYPVLDELLDGWEASHRPPWGGIEVIGHRFAPASHRLRDFLTRHQQPFRFVDADRETMDPADLPDLPIVLLPDGTRIARPTLTRLAEVLGLTVTASRPYYEVAIIGAGPAGLAAAVYSSSEGLATLLVDAEVPGGQAGTTSRIENYPGFPSGVSGAELARRAVAQARRFGAEILSPVEAVALERAGRALIVRLGDGRELGAATVVLATGLHYQRLEADGADRFEGAGIYYGATVSETESCAGQHVWIVGGANSAGQAALHLARHDARVTMVIRAASLEAGMSRYLIDEISDTPHIEVRLRSRVVTADGSERLQRIGVLGPDGTIAIEDAEYLFTFIGARPRTEWLDSVIARDRNGFLLTGSDLGPPDRIDGWDLPRAPFYLETSVPGVFAVGDARANSVKRLTSSVGEGAMGTALIHRYMAES
jgi:thioredoxin reductase (NADPH)